MEETKCVVCGVTAVLGGAVGEDTIVSRLDWAPKVGVSSRSRRDDSLMVVRGVFLRHCFDGVSMQAHTELKCGCLLLTSGVPLPLNRADRRRGGDIFECSNDSKQ